MSFVNSKNIKIFYIILFPFILSNCQLKAPKKSHGINFLENREKVLVVGKTNKNDVIQLIGHPHTISIKDKNTWIFFERTTTRGKLIKLGQNVLQSNNLLELKFNKYGVLKNKKILSKEDMREVKYSKVATENEISQKSFVGKFLSSIRQKMYGKRKF
jgi:outer membrane protein assembly factor BamE (lipoprotein component of BamABCDE complex)